jgi:hypothetical protein
MSDALSLASDAPQTIILALQICRPTRSIPIRSHQWRCAVDFAATRWKELMTLAMKHPRRPILSFFLDCEDESRMRHGGNTTGSAGKERGVRFLRDWCAETGMNSDTANPLMDGLEAFDLLVDISAFDRIEQA